MNKLTETDGRKGFRFFLLFRMGKLVLGNQLHHKAAGDEEDSILKKLIVGNDSQYSRQKRFHKI
jgi:hypothetical protein